MNTDDNKKWPGVAALGLFAVMAWVFLGAEFGEAASGFAGDAGVTASIGYAMFNIAADNAIASEGFLIPFEIIDLVLVAALVGAVMLARRDEGGTITSALRAHSDESEPSEVVADGGERTESSQASSDLWSDGGREQGGDQ